MSAVFDARRGMTEMRIIGCPEWCGSYYEGGPTGFETPYGVDFRDGSLLTHFDECRTCGGKGEIEIEVEPITLEDMDEAFG